MDETWTDAQGGAWTDAADWSPAGVPGAADTAIVATPGSYAVLIDQSETVAAVTLDNAGATILATGLPGAGPTTFAVTQGIALEAGRLELAGGVQTGIADGGQVYTLETAATLDLSGGIQGDGADPDGSLLACAATIDLIGNQTLNNITLGMGSSVELLATGGTTTLGPGFVLEQTGSLDSLDGAFVNEGLMALSGAPWVRIGAMQPSSLTNTGTIVTGSEDVVATLQEFANDGLLDIRGAFDLTVGGSYANTGTIALGTGATFDLNANTSLAALGSIANAGGTIGIGGTLDLGGGTLSLAPGATFADVLLSGSLKDGTVAPSGGTLTIAGGTFDAVTYDGVLDFSAFGTLTTLDVANGISVEGGTIDVTGPGDTLQLLDSETLDHVTLNLGSPAGSDAELLGDPAGTLTIGSDAVLDATGGQMTVAAGYFANQGSITAAGGSLSIAASSLTNAGTIALAGAGTTVTLDAETLSNTGVIAIGVGDKLVLQSVTYDNAAPPAGFSNTGTITMVPGSELVLDTTTGLGGLGDITGSGGTVDIAGEQTWFRSHATGVLDLGGSTLVVGGTSAISELIIQGTIEDGSVVLLPGGTLIPLASAVEVNVNQSAPCYAAGSRIRTARGNVAVEDLAVGELVLTASGAARPIVWIGQRRIDCRRHRAPELIWPVRVRAGAFEPSQPERDLLLSPDHAVSVPAADGGNDVLVPIKHLLNGLTIAQEPASSVHYFHIELVTHDILLAEGLPAESYLDTGNRRMFANGGAAIALNPEFFPRSWNDACAALRQSGPDVAAARRRLAARARQLGFSAEGLALAQVTAGGREIAPAAVRGCRHRFLLPAGAREAWIAPRDAAMALRVTGAVANGRVIDVSTFVVGAAALPLPPATGPLVLELLLERETARPALRAA